MKWESMSFHYDTYQIEVYDIPKAKENLTDDILVLRYTHDGMFVFEKPYKNMKMLDGGFKCLVRMAFLNKDPEDICAAFGIRCEL